MSAPRPLVIAIDDGVVGGLLRDAEARHRGTLVFGHGAGAGMRHRNMEAIAEAVAGAGLATLRFNFPYMEAGKSRVDGKPLATATIERALAAARAEADGPYLLGGHSFGGRMASHAVVDHALAPAGMIFCSFPLHAIGRPTTRRADHLDAIAAPMLFLSGSRDGMASPALLQEVVQRVGATLRWLDAADHGYKVLKRARRRQDDVFAEMAEHVDAWLTETLGLSGPLT